MKLENVSDRQMRPREMSHFHPDRQVGWGVSIWREMFDELLRSRELTLRLFIRDFTARYKQSVLGLLWAVILPLATVGTFVVLNSSGLIAINRLDVPYVIYALLGMMTWQIFSAGLASASNSIVSGGGMIVKVNFPKETMVLAGLAQAIVDVVIQFVILVLVFVYYGMVPKWTAIFFHNTLIPMLSLTVGLGFLFALLAVLIRDIPFMITLSTTLMLFLTPVLYPRPETGLLRTISDYNPLADFVTATRDVVLIGYLTRPVEFLSWSLLSILLFLVSWRLFHMVEPRMAERV